MRYWLFLLVIVFCKATSLQGQTMDTTINKKHYTHRAYYPTKYSRINLETDEAQSLLCVGNFENGKKTGHWIYFYPDGSMCAEGNYKDGKKTKLWVYYHGKDHYYRLLYSKNHGYTDEVVVTESGCIEVRDVANTQVLYVNGHRPRVCYPAHFLD